MILTRVRRGVKRRKPFLATHMQRASYGTLTDILVQPRNHTFPYKRNPLMYFLHLFAKKLIFRYLKPYIVAQNCIILDLSFQIFVFYLITSTIQCGIHNRAGLQFNCVLADDPPRPGEVGYATEEYVPSSFRTVVWVLLHPARTR